ncbi:DEAD/DEAH box helicase [Maridesulfovibrio bastinii]|uniref:DEAD/DEAH box helicase n=1 Tax=Maridesulfovibrio bastinii TaxID=47157 RepID=UPI000554E25A|nr:DEAD/DEAH box helicase [Maridesulfovibrio bastinii]
MTFSTFSFDQRINSCVKACGYETPTPIQSRSIPLILKGHDVLGLAQTGTGKTAAFALPILQRLLSRASSGNAPKVLVLAPTRELALQINENFTELSRNTGIRSCVAIGGVGMGPQIKACRSANIIVACPGRLVGLMAKKAVNLGMIDVLVLDEADRMLDMGFMPDIKKILSYLPTKRQNLLFSATMPRSIRAFADKILVNPETVKIDTAVPVTSIEHTFYKTQNSGKIALLETLIGQERHQSMLIFTRTKHKAKKLSYRLSRSGHNTTFLQGNMSQGQRERALNGFRDGDFTIMVATDIAARGIDCDRVTHVINYDMPDTVETYTHRIGRTGRAGRDGFAISLVTSDDLDQMKAIQKTTKVRVEEHSSFANAPKKNFGGNKIPSSGKDAGKFSRNRNRKSGRKYRAA